jgi:hypothetical protein
MNDDMPSNVEPFTAEVLARRTIERYGDAAGFHAAMQSDIFEERGNRPVAKIWYRASRIIEAIRKLKEEAGGSLNDYMIGQPETDIEK